VCGPFIPRYVPKNITWYKQFTNLLSDRVKLCGLTLNYFPWNKEINYPIVQSMAFCTDIIGLNLLFMNNIFCNSDNAYTEKKLIDNNKKNFIIKYEHGLSKVILESGFEVVALYIADINKFKTDDTWYNNKYLDSTINPFETMFIKKNRISSPIIELYNRLL
jgi:hypothetical protein